ncbi:MAG: ABC transporter permease [Chloroflexota bacterium]|nr:ABC transporter permease [Chloroflexota bacterium]
MTRTSTCSVLSLSVLCRHDSRPARGRDDLSAWAAILGSGFTVSTGHLGLLAVVSLLGALGGAALGLTLGTFVQPSQIGLMFSVILTPLLFTGCVYYPWSGLHSLRWFQIVTCFSPLTDASEGFRSSLVPQSPHMATGYILLGQIAFLILFTILGVRGFLRKALG